MTNSPEHPKAGKDQSLETPVRVTSSAQEGYAQRIDAGGHELRADEPVSAGGSNTGPSPTDLLLASLGACTSIALRMYAQRKGWDLGSIQVSIALRDEGENQRIERHITFSAPLLPEQRSRLTEISEKTPVTKMLKNGIAIRTILS